MAQWSRVDRTLHAKLVYYGPAFGGKTSNLESLHRITDPQRKNRLLSLQTANDRTLFFDLLPFELGDIFGYQVAMKVYTVPGQVRYDTTRQVVLGGADAIVFVADSSRERRDQNVWSAQNLKMNMRARRLEPRRIPVLFQFNKRDLPDAASMEEVAEWLAIKPQSAVPAVATQGHGVLETFMAACKMMLQRLVSAADQRTRNEIDLSQLDAQVDRAFAPHLARVGGGVLPALSVAAAATVAQPSCAPPIEGEELLERSVQASVQLGERLVTETTRASSLERQAVAFQQLCEALRSVGVSFDRQRIVDRALEAVQQVLDAPVVSLLRESRAGGIEAVRVVGSPASDPLLGGGETGRELAVRLLAGGKPIASGHLAAAPLTLDDASAAIVAYHAEPEGSFDVGDVRFLGTVAAHLAMGLEKSRLHEQLARQRDALEATVAARTEQLRETYQTLREMSTMKDRFLGNLSHEMKTPLTAILSAAHVIRDYASDGNERLELIESIASSAETLQRQLDDLFRLVNLEKGPRRLELSEVVPECLVEEAIQLAGHAAVQYHAESFSRLPQCDLHGLARALANLIDNAVKFSPAGETVKVVCQPGRLGVGADAVEAMVVSVLDRGTGVGPADRERIFQPFEQGGDVRGPKPSGIGVGLYESRTMARRHGGDVELRPREGGGTEFRLIVPLEPSPEVLSREQLDESVEVSRV